jgi:hypothetical protein
MACAVSSLTACCFLILAALGVENDAAMSGLNPRSGSAFKVVLHNAFDRLLPCAHLVGISHLNPLQRASLLQEAAILGDKSQARHSLEKPVEFFWLTAGHHIDSVALIGENVGQYIKNTLKN